MNRIYAATPEAEPLPSQPSQPASQVEKRKRSKNLYLLVAGILTIVIIGGALFIPPSQAAIPLTVDYAVGEKMLYTTDISVGIQIQNSTLPSSFMDQTTSNNLNVTSQQTIEVVSFDGQYYTLNHTTTMTIADKPFTVSLLEKMNKTGYSTYMIDLGNSGPLTESSTAYQEYLTQLISRPEVKVGDRIIIQFPTTENTIFAVIGNLTLTFGGIEELTVPAGTFKVFRIDLTSTDLKLDLSKLQTTATADLLNGLKMSISSQMYMEYGTMRQIKSTMQENMIYQSSMLNATINLTADMTLNQDIKP